ncbi:MAG: beta-galactosidase [Prevotellaceae bacterium]|nr:beta-galactosidase [Prevotellaceae bacterium]
MKKILCLFSLLAAMMMSAPAFAQKAKGTFEAGDGSFLLNGKPFVVKAAEIHYPRIPRAYWEHRIKMCKALGMNTICIYIFWNFHEQEEGQFNWTGDRDVAEFCRLIQKNGMYVIVRPGPYACAEWEMGGLPWWLLKKKDIKLRERDPYFMERVKIFETEVGKQLAPLTIQNGGPIIMVQVENEYGSYGVDKPYMSEVRDCLRSAGFDKVALFQCDWSSNFLNNGLDDLVWTMNFGTGANIDDQFRKLKEVRPNSPLMCSEFWSGWFDKWGGKHETRSSKDMVSGLREMLDKNISFSLYMTHGGTSFGHWAGANSPGFAPDVTSYDYDAPINEYGQATPKFFELREMLQQYTDKKLPAVPNAMPIITIPEFEVNEWTSMFDFNTKTDMQKSYELKTMEEFDQGWGSMVYMTKLPKLDKPAKLHIENGHDFIQVYENNKLVGSLDRRMGEKDIVLPPCGENSTLMLVVEAMGRINFGRAIKDFKGIVGDAELTIDIDGNNYTGALKNWETYLIPDTYEFYKSKPFDEQTKVRIGSSDDRQPGYYKATFNVGKVGDTFIDMSTWGKGLVYVNGHALGRFWEIGPQQTLYCPGCWLKKGQNEIIIFDIVGPKEKKIQGLDHPIIDQLQNAEPPIHRTEGQNLDLSGETSIAAGAFAAGNGWQEVKFDAPQTGRYVCLEAINNHNGDEYACIAELYLLDQKGERLSREPWKIAYADSEDIVTGNRAGDKIYDLQESTFWSTVKGVQFPHHIVIDLGKEQTLTALQYLPRMESNVPGGIKDYKIYVKKDNFKY